MRLAGFIWIVMMLLLVFTACRQPSGEKEHDNPLADTVPADSMISDNLEMTDSLSTDSTTVMIPEIEKRIMEKGLENVQQHLPEVIVKLKYSTADNFLGTDVYGELTHAYLQPECISKLKRAFALLQQKKPGHTFIIYDAVRPLSVQQLMWDTIDVAQEKKFWYVAPPGKGSIHNYGMAVDLTIADSTGKALDMGTEFDHFGKLSFPRFTQKYLDEGTLNQQQADNRNLLIHIMHQSGFTVARTEWWHFNATSLASAKQRFEAIP
jgi:D-alanyl-D-alanine dipeptidase